MKSEEFAHTACSSLNGFRDVRFADSQLVRDFRHFQPVVTAQKRNLFLPLRHIVERGFQSGVFSPAIRSLVLQRIRFLYKIGRVATEGQFVDGIRVIVESYRVILTVVAVTLRTVRTRENQRNVLREFRRFRFRKGKCPLHGIVLEAGASGDRVHGRFARFPVQVQSAGIDRKTNVEVGGGQERNRSFTEQGFRSGKFPGFDFRKQTPEIRVLEAVKLSARVSSHRYVMFNSIASYSKLLI